MCHLISTFAILNQGYMYDLSLTILFKLVYSYLIAQKFTQWPWVNTKGSVKQIASCNPCFRLRLHYAIYRLRFCSNLLIRVWTHSISYNDRYIVNSKESAGQIAPSKTSLKATFHLTISTRGQRATGKIQRNNYHHGSCGPSLTGKTMSVFLIFTQGTHRNVKNRWVKSSLKRGTWSTSRFHTVQNLARTGVHHIHSQNGSDASP